MKSCGYISDRGDFISGDVIALAAALGVRASSELEAAAIANLGFVRIIVRAGSIEFKFRPRAITDEATAALYEHIYTANTQRTVLTTLVEGRRSWNSQISVDPSMALALAGDLILDQQALLNGRIIEQPITINQLSTKHPFSAALNSWSPSLTSRDYFQTEAFKLLRGRYMLFRHDEKLGTGRLEEIGHGKPALVRNQFAPLLGEAMTSHPDIWFGRAVARVLTTAARLGPSLSRVDAMVKWTDSLDCRHRYQRIILPLQDDGRLVLLCGALEDLSIDLRRSAT